MSQRGGGSAVELQRGEPVGTTRGTASMAAPDVVEVEGPATYREEIFVHASPGRVMVSTSIGGLLDQLRDEGVVPPLDPGTISSQLNHILWITPTTAFSGIARLLPGQRMTIELGKAPAPVVTGDFPYFDADSRQDVEPDAGHLRDLIVAATERALAMGAGRGLLMLSSGKDSTALALALAELGRRDVACVTFADGPDDPEVGPAADTCRRLGLHHEVVALPAPVETRRMLQAFFASSPLPTTDLAAIPYALAVQQTAAPSGVLLDGSGNDLYMGFVETRARRLKRRLRVRGRHLATALTQVLPVDSPTNYLLRSRIAGTFAGRTMRHRELRSFYPDAVDTHRDLYERSTASRDLDAVALVCAFNERFALSDGPLLKVRLAAEAPGMIPGIPFCDEDLVDYYFHLPEAHRFDRGSGINKVLLRAMLLEFAGYDAAAVGKRPFVFDGARFLAAHRGFVLDEIASCGLWNADAGRIARRWLDRLDRRPFLHHALLGWFQVSAWHNHSRYLRPVPQGSVPGTARRTSPVR